MALRIGTQQKAEQAYAVQAQNAAYSDDDHAKLVDWYESAEEATRDARQLAERDRDYYDNKQLTAKELETLRQRGQPEIIINKIQTKVNFLRGYEASQRTDPRGFPRNPNDEDAAGACTDALRYLKDDTKADRTFSALWENMLVEGYGGAELGLTPGHEGGNDLTFTHVPWDRLFYDPHSRKDDFSDARYNGIVIWMDYDDVLEMWPDKEDILAKTVDDEFTRTYSDRPHWKQWAMHGNRKRVRVVQMYHRKGEQWCWCIFTKGGKLAAGEVIFKDEKGKSFNPLIMQSAFVDRDNNRYGFVRALISPQDEINKRRSRLLHMAMGRPSLYEEGAVDDVDEMKREMRKPDGAVKVNPNTRFEVLDNSVEVAGQTALLQHATQEIELMGPNAVLQGKGERNASGRAKMIDQQGGQTEIYPLMDNLSWLKQRFYMYSWAIVRQEWTEQKWVRVTDDEKNIRFVGFNRQVTVAEDLLSQAIKNGVPEDEAKAQLAQQAQDPMIMMQMQQVARVENVPAEMGMDIVVEEVPDTANLQQEQFEILAQLATAGVQFPPKVYIQASALRDKDKLIEALEEGQNDPAAQAVGEAQYETMVTEIEKLKAEIGDIKASTIKKLAEADAVDMSFGTVTDPEIIEGGAQPSQGQQSASAAPGGRKPRPMPQQAPSPPPQGQQEAMGGGYDQMQGPPALPPPAQQQFAPAQSPGF